MATGGSLNSHAKGLQMALQGVRMGFKPAMRDALQHIGHVPIKALHVCRAPLGKGVGAIIKLFRKREYAAGPNDPALRTDHDALFHLFLIVELSDGKLWCLQKNEDIDLIRYKPVPYDDIFPRPFMAPRERWKDGLFSTNLLLTNAIQFMGPANFFRYNAFAYNCQNFVMNCLLGNSIAVDSDARVFIMQDVSNLVPSWTKKLAGGITSFYNRLKTAVVGAGDTSRPSVFYDDVESDDMIEMNESI